MKKILFASTALVAAGLLTAGTASASDKIHINVGGFSRWWVVGAWNSNTYESANLRATPNVDVKGDNEIHFGGNTTLDNGMKVGVMITLEGGGHTDMTTDTIDKSFAWVDGNFGKFILGTDKAVNYLMAVTAPTVAGGTWDDGGIVTGGFALDQPSLRLAGGNTTRIATTNNATGLQYYTPNFHGFTLGLGYIPKGNEDNRGVYNLNGGSYSTADMPIQSTFGGGLLYADTFNGIGIKASANYSGSKLGKSTQGNSAADWFEQNYGANVTYAGITLGGSYRHQQANYVDGSTYDLSQARTTSGGGSMSNGDGYDVGVKYATGPYAVGFSYFHSAVNVCNLSSYCRSQGGISGQSKTNFYQLAGKYNLGPGVDIVTLADYGEFNDGAASTSTASATQDKLHNSGWVFTSGLFLAF
jgi:hypothetical protein